MTRRSWLRESSIVLLVISARALAAQPVIGRIIECRDRPQLLVNAGYLTDHNQARRPGFAGRAMIVFECDARGRDGLELGFAHAPYSERASQNGASGSGMISRYLGVVTERSLAGLAENLHFVLGLGMYGGEVWNVREETSYYQSQAYRNRYDSGSREGGLGASIGAAVLLNATPNATVHFDFRQHVSPNGPFSVLSAGILF
jgi:hypothetical protein